MPKKTAKKSVKKSSPKIKKSVLAPKGKKFAKKPASVKVTPEVAEDDEPVIGEIDEFLDEEKPHERMPVKIRIGESLQEAEETEDKTGDEDELSPWEEGFLEGTEHEGEKAACARCGKILGDKEEVVEREFHEEIFFFCSEKCARAGPRDQHSRQE